MGIPGIILLAYAVTLIGTLVVYRLNSEPPVATKALLSYHKGLAYTMGFLLIPAFIVLAIALVATAGHIVADFVMDWSVSFDSYADFFERGDWKPGAALYYCIILFIIFAITAVGDD